MIKIFVEEVTLDNRQDYIFDEFNQPHIERCWNRMTIEGKPQDDDGLLPEAGSAVYITTQKPISNQGLFEDCVEAAKSGNKNALDALPYISRRFFGDS